MESQSSSISLGQLSDLPKLLSLTQNCIHAMSARGIDQWDDIYPNADILQQDITAQTLWVSRIGSDIAGCITLDGNLDPGWTSLNWSTDSEKSAAIHRLMVHPDFQGQGLARQLMNFAEGVAFSRGYMAIRLDAFEQNPAALALYSRLSYTKVGTVNFRKGTFVCWEKLLSN